MIFDDLPEDFRQQAEEAWVDICRNERGLEEEEPEGAFIRGCAFVDRFYHARILGAMLPR